MDIDLQLKLMSKEKINRAIEYGLLQYQFWLVRGRPFFHIEFTDSKKDAEILCKRIKSHGFMAANTKVAKRWGVYASPKGESVIDWYDYHKKVGNIPKGRK